MAGWLVLIPFIILVLMNSPVRRIIKHAYFGLLLVFLSWQLGFTIFGSQRSLNLGNNSLAPWLKFQLNIDSLSVIVLAVISLAGLVSLILAQVLIKENRPRQHFLNLFTIAILGMNAVTMLEDVFSLYVFLEVTAVSSFVLIALQKNRDCLEASFKYLVMSSVATLLLLSGVALFILTCSGTSFAAISEGMAFAGTSPWIKVALGLFTCGLLIKSGMIPFHAWVPDAYAAASDPVSVLLAGAVTKVAGLYAILRLVIFVWGFSPVIEQTLLFVGALSVVGGALLALAQKDFKRMLAYSSISQLGYVLLGLGSGTMVGVAGAIFHFFNHTVFKSLLFVNAASFKQHTGSDDMEKLKGVSSVMPCSSITSLAGFFSGAGIPPFAGFWSKLLVILGLWEASRQGYAVIAILAGLLTMGYFLNLERKIFLGGESVEFKKHKVNNTIVWLEVTLALLTLLCGLFYPYLLEHFMLPAAASMLP